MSYTCKVCGKTAKPHGEAIVLKKYKAAFFQCADCQFIFAEEPIWLDEAYSRSINFADTGYVVRNIWARDITSTFIELYIHSSGPYLDFGAGYGLFVRLMRDMGYNFFAYDKHTTSLFAHGFEEEHISTSFKLVTAFEVLEHLECPEEILSKIQLKSDLILFTTSILPDPAPLLNEWGYYGLSHGQHIAFYSLKSLEILGKKFGYNFVSNNRNLHLWYRDLMDMNCLKKLEKFWPRLIANLKQKRRGSLYKKDNQYIEKQIENGIL